jgi:hypothetical protein
MEVERFNTADPLELDIAEGQIINQLRESSIKPYPDSALLPDELKQNVVLTTVDYVLAWARSRSIFPLMFGLACCAFEMIGSAASRFDIAGRPDDCCRHHHLENGPGVEDDICPDGRAQVGYGYGRLCHQRRHLQGIL